MEFNRILDKARTGIFAGRDIRSFYKSITYNSKNV